MPNRELNYKHCCTIKNNILAIVERRYRAAYDEFPLTHDEVQDLLIHPDTHSIIKNLRSNHGVNTISKYDMVYFTMPIDDRLPRPPVICVGGRPSFDLSDNIYMFHNNNTKAADFSRLPSDRMEALIRWCNYAVTERRHYNLTDIVLDRFLFNKDPEMAPTLWHVMVRWPALKLGFGDGGEAPSRRRGSDGGTLSEWALSVPRYPSRYGWGKLTDKEAEWYQTNAKLMAFVDNLILGATLLTTPDREVVKRPVAAAIHSWPKLNGELA